MKLERIILLPLLAAVALLIAACEETLPASDVPYREQLIAQGMLSADSTNDTIRFVRTLPLDQVYLPSKAQLNDVTAQIIDESSGRAYTLRPVGHGAYVASDLVPASGHRYTLNAEWQGKHLTGSTTVPVPPTIDTVIAVEYVDDPYQIDGVPTRSHLLEATVTPSGNVAYGMRYMVFGGQQPGFPSTYTYLMDDRLRRVEDADSTGKLRLRPKGWSGNIYSEPPYDVMVGVYVYDMSYYDYYTSRRHGDDELFGSPGDNTRWNVTGDGFGIFTSRAMSAWAGTVK